MPGKFKEINIKSDMPTADDAIKRITYHMHNSKKLGYKALKIIHGYGSTGTGGKIKIRARKYLDDQKQRGVIKGYIPGEDFSIFDEATRSAFALCDDLRGDPDLERHNNGITIIIL